MYAILESMSRSCDPARASALAAHRGSLTPQSRTGLVVPVLPALSPTTIGDANICIAKL